MAKNKRITRQQATAPHQGHQQTAGGMAFDPSGARAGQSSAWGRPSWATGRRPSDEAAAKTLDPVPTAARLRQFDPPDISQMSSLTVNLTPSI